MNDDTFRQQMQIVDGLMQAQKATGSAGIAQTLEAKTKGVGRYAQLTSRKLKAAAQAQIQSMMNQPPSSSSASAAACAHVSAPPPHQQGQTQQGKGSQ